MNFHNFEGLMIGLGAFLIIGVCHPIVIKGEYYFGQRLWWMFLLAGVGLCIASLASESVLVSSLLGVGAFSCFWGIKETRDQQERVRKGWFPRNPNRTYWWDKEENTEANDASSHQSKG